MNNKTMMSASHWSVVLVYCLAVFAVLVPSSSQAQGWKFEPKVRAGVEYDDNADLAFRTDQEIEATGYILDLRADLNYTSPTKLFSLQPKAVFKRYSDESQFDTDDYFLRSHFRHKGQKTTIGFRFDYQQEAIRTAEQSNVDLDTVDPDELTDDSTARVFLTGTRDRLILAPSWAYQLSNISSIGARLQYIDVGYNGAAASLFLDDYSDVRLNLDYSRGFSDVNTGLMTITARKFDPESSAGVTTGYGVMAGFSHELSEKTRIRALFGFESIEQEGFDDDLEPGGSRTRSRTLEIIRMFVQYRRSISAGGSGAVSVRDAFSLNFDRRLNERISAGLGFRVYQTRASGGVVSIDDRNYLQIQGRFQWYLSRPLIAEAYYSYTISDFSDSPGIGSIAGERANSNRVGIWLVYQPRTNPRL
jgi:hypothetical protein